jgi:hypothetical protein
MEVDSWKDWNVPLEKKKTLVCVKDGCFTLMANSGRIVVCRWNGKTFEKQRIYVDTSFADFQSRGFDDLRMMPSCDLQCGFLATTDASGLVVKIWDLISEDSSPLVTVSELKNVMNPHDQLLSVFGYLIWSMSGNSVLFTMDSGMLFDINICPI